MTSIQAVRTAKKSLRKSVAQILSSLTTEQILKQCELPILFFFLCVSHSCSLSLAASIVTQSILKSPIYANATSVSIYVSMESGEIDTDQLCRHALNQGESHSEPFPFLETTSMHELITKPRLSHEQESDSTSLCLRPHSLPLRSLLPLVA